jgi:hypothetical protein
VIIRHDIEDMIKRMNTLCKIRFDTPLLKVPLLTHSDMERLIIESLSEHKNWIGLNRQHRVYKDWEKAYW